MSIIIENIKTKLNFFEEEDKKYIRNLLDYNMSVKDEDLFTLLRIIRSLNEDTEDKTKDNFIDLIENLTIKKDCLVLHQADKGEDIKVNIKLRDSDDYSNSILVARDSDTKDLLSDDTMQGSSATVQTVILNDINYPVQTFAKVFILAEKPDNSSSPPVASGDVNTVINKMFLFIDENAEKDQ